MSLCQCVHLNEMVPWKYSILAARAKATWSSASFANTDNHLMQASQ